MTWPISIRRSTIRRFASSTKDSARQSTTAMVGSRPMWIPRDNPAAGIDGVLETNSAPHCHKCSWQLRATHAGAGISYVPRPYLPIGNYIATRQIVLQRGKTRMPGGFSIGCRMVLAVATLAGCATTATHVFAIETSYGEDPVPDAHRFNGSICLGYGVDPVPLRSPLERWTFWRSERGRAAEGKSPARVHSLPPVSSNPSAVASPVVERPQAPWWRFDRHATKPALAGR